MAQAVTEAGLVTADELLRMPGDGVRRELIRGEIREMPPAGEEHSEIQGEFLRQLGNYVREHRLGKTYGELGCRLASDPDTVLAPDAAFIRAERLSRGRPNRGYRSGPPDLALEILSPSDSADALEEKVWEWLAAGCRMVVVVNPRRRTATVYRSFSEVTLLTENDEVDGGDVVPGWRMPVRELFL
ncbi:Uma2 family endonuclease [Longimicrobium sp.]|uniref:Uma2 family endonuclease n=1 Tax=Longimicrobium sp. TaxID=2029185 RepID=UPI002D0F7534|nr:Uma2 family endonuclease [Longimicrobium sp.]HSU18076.1 Uma2 family endonuclease [Longimicrobium sp.]